MTYIFTQFTFDFSCSMEEVVATVRSVLSNFGSIKKNDLAKLFYNLIFPYPEENFLGFLRYNKQSQPWEGTAIKTLNTHQYQVSVYKDGKVQSTKVINQLKELIMSD